MKNKIHLRQCNKFELKLLIKHINYHAQHIKAWKRGMSEIEAETFEILEQIDESNRFLIQKSGGIFARSITSNLLDEEVYFKLSIGRRSYCGKTTIQKLTNTNYILSIPEKVFIFDRRQNIRLRSTSAVNVRVKYYDKKFEVFDISAKSLSMRIEESDLNIFQMDKIHKTLKVAINKGVFTIPYFRVISSRVITGPTRELTNFYTIICLFYKLPKKMELEITRYIESLARDQAMLEQQ